MSNRTEAQVTYAAELKAAHIAQIDALTAPGLTREERIKRFAGAALFSGLQTLALFDDTIIGDLGPLSIYSAAARCWVEGGAKYSLFAHLPGCRCPVIEVARGRAAFAGIPASIPADWSPTADDLQAFARVQQERRLG